MNPPALGEADWTDRSAGLTAGALQDSPAALDLFHHLLGNQA